MNRTLAHQYQYPVYHIFYWLCYIIYEQCSNIFIYHFPTPIPDFIYFYGCNIALFYTHCFLLSRTLDKARPRYLGLALLLAGEMLLFLALKGVWEFKSIVRESTVSAKEWHDLKQAVALDFSRNLYYMFFATVIWSGMNLGRFQRRASEAALLSARAEQANTELRYEFARAQNAFLKQQLNPHLLFNTLNTIYGSVYRHSPEDASYVLLLSEIMRYSFEEPGADGRVPLEMELSQLENLIRLNTYRSGGDALIDYTLNGAPSRFAIIPLVLVTLTENMIKHGDLRYSPRSLEVHISGNGELRFVTRNVPRLVRGAENRRSIGLANTRLRLDYAYPGAYTLAVTETDDLFLLELTINLSA